mgnify:CR=1 FL=1
MFQFQSGTIKSERRGRVRSYEERFQFQSGTIKSRSDNWVQGNLQFGFNSNLVRLKAQCR